MRKRQEIQKLLRPIAALLAIAVPAIAGSGVYFHYSPSLPLAEHWFDYVDSYPVHEFGVAVELPGPSVFRWRFEGNYAPFAESGVLTKGAAFWASAGLVMRNDLSERFAISFGPQLILGWVLAEGTYDYIDSDGKGYYIDFDGKGNGIGIGMSGSAALKLGENIRLGLQPSVTYFGVAQEDVPIVGRDALDPSVPPDYGIFKYKGEYIALSLRVFAGFEF